MIKLAGYLVKDMREHIKKFVKIELLFLTKAAKGMQLEEKSILVNPS